jgi:hypothetical protein
MERALSRQAVHAVADVFVLPSWQAEVTAPPGGTVRAGSRPRGAVLIPLRPTPCRVSTGNSPASPLGRPYFPGQRISGVEFPVVGRTKGAA